VFLNELIKSGASAEQVTEGLLSIILGGRDTIASTLSALFWHLARRPEVVEKLRIEIDELGVEAPTWEDLRNMRYLNFCIKEGKSPQASRRILDANQTWSSRSTPSLHPCGGQLSDGIQRHHLAGRWREGR
jgi:Cytochrome P450